MSNLADQLRPAMTGPSGSLMRVVLRELPTIEAARVAGLTYEQIAAGLGAVGAPISGRVLRELVYRARRRAQASGPGRPAQPNPDAGAALPIAIEPPDAVTTAAMPPFPQFPPPSLPPVPPRPSDAPTPLASATAPPPAKGPVGGDDFITDILRTPPDLDALARRFHASRRKDNP